MSDLFNCSPKQPKIVSGSIRLEIKGLEHVPSFKNKKTIYRRSDGTPFIATGKKKKQWMDSVITVLASQLWSAARTALGETSTVAHQRSWIASFVPSDDARQIIRRIVIETVDVEPGQEGADIVIERL